VWPLDVDTIVASIRKTGRCVLVQEAPRTAGVCSEILALINEKAFDDLQAPVKRVCGYDTPVPYYTMEKYYLPSEKRVLAGIRSTVAF